MANILIFDIIIHKFNYKQKLYLMILFEIYKILKINFYNTIILFYLAVCLQIKYNKNFLFNFKKIIKQ